MLQKALDRRSLRAKNLVARDHEHHVTFSNTQEQHIPLTVSRDRRRYDRTDMLRATHGLKLGLGVELPVPPDVDSHLTSLHSRLLLVPSYTSFQARVPPSSPTDVEINNAQNVGAWQAAGVVYT